jgi:hypothetical protein
MGAEFFSWLHISNIEKKSLDLIAGGCKACFNHYHWGWMVQCSKSSSEKIIVSSVKYIR